MLASYLLAFVYGSFLAAGFLSEKSLLNDLAIAGLLAMIIFMVAMVTVIPV